MKNIAVFIDRDGVLNKKPTPHDYVKNYEEFFWNDGAKKLIKEIKLKGFLAIVVSNQRGIARGKMTKEFVVDLHKRINECLESEGYMIDAFYFCPHAEGCECRKPKPGMFFKAAKDLNIDLTQSVMVGDSLTDRVAAENAGCKRTVLIESDSVDVDYIMREINELLT